MIKKNVNGTLKTVTNIRVPKKWKRFEYLESTGTQWIDTGLTLSETQVLKIESKTGADTRDGTSSPFFGTNFYKTGIMGLYHFNSDNKTYALYMGGTGVVNKSIPANSEILYSASIDCAAKSATVTMNGTSGTLSNKSVTDYTSTITLFKGSGYTPSASRCWYFKMYLDDSLVRHFVPCQYNGQYGMWDLVENKFYGNKGTGTFNVGAEVKNYDEIELLIKIRHDKKAYWWNLLIKNGNFSDDYNSWLKSSTTTTVTSNVCSIIGSRATSYNYQEFNVYANHTYLFIADAYVVSQNTNAGLNIADFSPGITPTTLTTKIVTKYNVWEKLVIRYTFNKDSVGRFELRCNNNEVNYRNVICVDLTAMFGSGYEPTAEQFRKMFPCDYYPYNAGEWRYANGGQYVNFNQLANINSFKSDHGLTVTKLNNYTIQVKGLATETFSNGASAICTYKIHNIIPNHKYYVRCTPIGNYGGLNFRVYNNFNTSIVRDSILIANDTYYPQPDKCSNIYIYNNSANREIDCIIGFTAYDLTQMFGEGNEPTTVEEFKALYPNEYYDYVESRYEYTPGYYEKGQVVQHIPATAFDNAAMDKVIIPIYEKKNALVTDGIAYINTGLALNNDFEIYTNFSVDLNSNKTQPRLYSNETTSLPITDLYFPNKKAWVRIFGSSHLLFNVESFEGEHYIKYKNNIWETKLGDTLLSGSTTYSNVTSPLVLFTRHNATGSSEYTMKCKIFYFKIYKSGVLVRDFIPATLGGKPGLYDKVEHKMYYNANSSGSFTVE